MSQTVRTCPACGRPVAQSGRGRPRVWCSDRCRRLASDARRAERLGYVGVDGNRVSAGDQSAVIDLVAGDPDLLAQVVERTEHHMWGWAPFAAARVARVAAQLAEVADVRAMCKPGVGRQSDSPAARSAGTKTAPSPSLPQEIIEETTALLDWTRASLDRALEHVRTLGLPDDQASRLIDAVTVEWVDRACQEEAERVAAGISPEAAAWEVDHDQPRSL